MCAGTAMLSTLTGAMHPLEVGYILVTPFAATPAPSLLPGTPMADMVASRVLAWEPQMEQSGRHLGIRQRGGGKRQLASSKYPRGTPLLAAYNAAFSVLQDYEAGTIPDRASLKQRLKDALAAAV
eukprot:4304294-Amphidinium_carterae.2